MVLFASLRRYDPDQVLRVGPFGPSQPNGSPCYLLIRYHETAGNKTFVYQEPDKNSSVGRDAIALNLILYFS